MTPAHAARLFHTVRHLRAIQFLYRAKYRLMRRARIKRTPDRLACADAGATLRTACPSSPPEYLGGGRLRFLNRAGDLARGWHPPGHDRLWLYNLHYFNYLNQHDRDKHRDELARLIADWTAVNPVGLGTGWEPYPLSLRIVSWVKWAAAGMPLGPKARSSLYLQARYLEKRLEYHLLGNHLFANAKALIYAGLFFRGAEADRWLNQGRRIMRREIDRQVLSDGGHVELSPMYHALFVEDLLDILNLCPHEPSGERAAAIAECMASARKPIAGMLAWLRTMCHPDGEIALLNDAAFGIAKSCPVLFDYAGRLGIVLPPAPAAPALTALRSSGYIRAEQRRYTALLDIARLGPDYQPGHGHADTLGFELSLDGKRLFVNAGTSTYATGRRRDYERGTSAHNTVVLDARNSSDVWSAFRVGRRAYPRDVAVQTRERTAMVPHTAVTEPRWTVAASHTGYRRLCGIVHRRHWQLDPDKLTIIDELRGPKGNIRALPGPAHALLRLAPGFDAKPLPGDAIAITSARGTACVITHDAGRVEMLDEFFAPEFGMKQACRVLRLHFDGPNLTTQLSFDAQP